MKQITIYRILFLFMAILFRISLFAQADASDAMLFGDVKVKGTNNHIPYATIFVKGTTMGTAADETGHFKLAHLPEGKQTIVAQFVGFKPQEVEVIMKRGKGTELYFELEEDLFNLEQVVVTGTRTQHYVKNVPVRTEVVTSQALKSKNAWNVFEALEGVPGIRVENQCQACNFTMVRMQGLGSEHTQVLINGQPIYSGLASVYGLEQIGTGDVDRIEVIKGAGSALYGSSAIAGAINIITREPSPVPTVSADIQLGSHQTNIYNLNASMRNEKGTVGLSLYAQKIDHGVIDATGEGMNRDDVKKKDGISDRVASKLHNMGAALYIHNLFFGNDKLVFRGKAINEKREGGVITDDLYKNPFSEGTESIHTDRYEAEANYRLGFSGGELNFNNSYINHNRNATNDSYLGDYMDTHDGASPDVQKLRPYLAKENSLINTLTLGKQLGEHSLLIGLQHYVTRLNESGMYVVVDEASDWYGDSYRSTARKHAHEAGAFLQDEWQVTDNLTVVPGVRIDHHHSGEEYASDRKVFDSDFPETSFNRNSVNPRLAVKYHAGEHLTLRANAGTGFRAPYGFSEDLHLCSGSPRVWKSSDLKAETSRSINLSADYHGHRYQLSANLFYTYLKDKIDFSDADEQVKNLGYTYQWRNIDDAVVQGIEMSLQVNPVHYLSIGADVGFNKGVYQNAREDWKNTEYENVSDRIPRFPSTTGSIKAEYTPYGWNFTLYGLYQGSMYIDYFSEEAASAKIKKSDPYMTVNASLSKTFGKVRLYGGGKNIFSYLQDEKHLDDAAFLYAPVYGALWYAGISVNITH
ncbi:MAG: TonB-dependent receptor [Proteiniphilum sp.]|nr:TonB-dependent receptor [Proteiniphilum sp.]MDD4158511.1 TonB-dependent receptor [Proteiniphilum sp.]